ncbi:galactose-1-epimerase [Bacillus mangrovi]|uniref:Aldose 1-epimerase n=1 Tax=Metabacillus mangrovi TaxID=1491830 RepID=A0A7X2S430_9BACI|nr:aldose epimerase family protein [Metabacillus mangrovi]MTH53032.1 galactose-1-epimerase [Metabacillus mangrovi]
MIAAKTEFGTIDGRTVYAYTLKNSKGMEVTAVEYGCAITKILAPDRNGKLENVVLGCDSLEDYRNKVPYFGAVVGRVAGRIRSGDLPVGAEAFKVTANQEGHHLHGGESGFTHKIWGSRPLEDQNGVEFTYHSPDGEEGFPGNLEVKVTYILSEENELTLSYSGESDQDTVLNMTNHTYFNLSGNVKEDIGEHELTVPSAHYLELDSDSLPTGNKRRTEGTVFDFRKGRKLGEGFRSEDEQIAIAGGGYDHPFLLDEGREMVLYHEKSGRLLHAETDQPSVILYSSNAMGEDIVLQEGIKARKHCAVCLETQHPPDAVHHEGFPSVLLKKGETYHAYAKWKFTSK